VKKNSDDARRIGFIGFDGVDSADIAGPANAFSRVQTHRDGNDQSPPYDILMIAASTRAFPTECGLTFKPDTTFKSAPDFDTIIIPGGTGLRDPAVIEPICTFVRKHAPRTRRIVSLGSGIYGLASTGLLRGRRVASHWRYARDVASQFPALRVDENSLFAKDGQFYTSAGATAGIDLALFLIEEDYGPRVALAVARDLVVHLKRTGGQEQYSEALQFQTASISRLSELTTWILGHLNQDLSVETLAAKACLCPRQFGRRFKAELGASPAEFVERIRLDEARRRLSNTDATVESVAASVGFNSSDVFRRRFEQRVGMTPNEFRRRLNKSNTTAFPTGRNSVRRTQLVAA
jgi:transcriptional regulator GlxA family with amidase domain